MGNWKAKLAFVAALALPFAAWASTVCPCCPLCPHCPLCP